ncbi:hypothetical protein D3C73_1522880 [compost metagenome]
MVPTRIVEQYGKLRYTRNVETALKIAALKEKQCYICEYGIRILEVNKTWKQIVYEAKRLAPKEIESIKLKAKDDRWKYDLMNLEKIINL